MAAIAGATVNLTGSGEPERIRGRRVSASFFPILGVPPAAGRTFLPEEDQPDGERVVVLSHGLWQRRFASDTDVVGRTVSLDGESYTVNGVMPRGFQDLTDICSREETKLWLPYPFANDAPTESGAKRLRVVARLKPGVSLQRAAMEERQSGLNPPLFMNFPTSFQLIQHLVIAGGRLYFWLPRREETAIYTADLLTRRAGP
jgi:putative ABC transport system permease protein